MDNLAEAPTATLKNQGLFKPPASSIKVIESEEQLKKSISALPHNDTISFRDFDLCLGYQPGILCEAYGKLKYSSKKEHMGIEYIRQEIIAHYISKGFSEENSITKAKQLVECIFTSEKYRLVDPTIPQTKKAIEDRGIKNIILTGRRTGYPQGDNTKLSIEEQTVNITKELGLDYTGTFPQHKQVKFKESDFTNKAMLDILDLPQYEKSHGPMYMDGVMFTAGVRKDLVLDHFFNHIVDYRPKCIVFIDDKQKNLEDVQQWCEKNGIEFRGFHYVAFFNEKKDTYQPNLDAVKIQLDYLLENETWLFYDDAVAQLNSQCSNRPS